MSLAWTVASLACADILGLGDYRDPAAGAAGGAQVGQGGAAGAAGAAGAGGAPPPPTVALWGRLTGDGGRRHGGSAVAGNEVVVVGTVNGTLDTPGGVEASIGGDGFYARFDSSGVLVDARIYAQTDSQYLTSVTVGANGQFHVGGIFVNNDPTGTQSPSFPNPNLHGWVGRLFPNGDIDVSLQIFGDGGNQRVISVAWTPSGTYVAGDHVVVVTSPQNIPHNDGIDAFLGRVFPVTWFQPVLGLGTQLIYRLAAGPGELVLVGEAADLTTYPAGLCQSAGGSDALVVVTNLDGSLRWMRCYGDAAAQIAYAATVLAEPDGSYVVGGKYAGSVDFGDGTLPVADFEDAFVAKLDKTDGTAMWSTSFGGSGLQAVRAIVEDDSGRLWVVGTTWGTLELGNGRTLTHSGGNDSDAFLIQLSAGGELLAAVLFGGGGEHTLDALGRADDGSLFAGGSFEGTVAAEIFGDIEVVGAPFMGTAGELDAVVLRVTP